MVMFGYHILIKLITEFQSQINYTHCYSALNYKIQWKITTKIMVDTHFGKD